MADEIRTTEGAISPSRHWEAAKLMLAYFSDSRDDPTPRDIELVREMEKVLRHGW